jgi:uncharacterized protein
VGKVLLHNTHGKDDVERATLAFVVGNAGLSSGQEITMLLSVDGVWCAALGYTDGLQAQGYAALSQLMQTFVQNGGVLWVCGACAKARNLTAEQLIPGAKLVGAASAVEALVNGAQSLSW